MAPCTELTYEQCLLNSRIVPSNYATEEDYQFDADLLCQYKRVFWSQKISAATIVIIIYLVCKAYIQFAECSLMLSKSRIWKKGTDHYDEGQKAMVRSGVINCVFWFCVYVGSAAAASQLASPLDERANNIVIGFSQLFAGVVFLMLSITIPVWFGTYHSNKQFIQSRTSSRGIQFNLSFNIMTEMSSMFFFDLYFSGSDGELNVLYGALIGLAAAFLILYIIILTRSKYKQHKQKVSILLMIVFAVASWYMMWSGIYFIVQVWGNGETRLDIFCGSNCRYSLQYAVPWIVAIIAVHLFFFFYTRQKHKKRQSQRFTSAVFDSSVVRNAMAKKKNDTIVNEDNGNGDDDNDDSNDKNDAEKGDNGGNEDNLDGKDNTEELGIQEEHEVEQEAGGHVQFAVVDPTNDDDDDDDDDDDKHGESTTSKYVEPKDAPSYYELLGTKLASSYPYTCRCLKEKHHVDNISSRRLDYVLEGHARSTAEHFGTFLRRFCWYLLSLFFTILTIINIGASFEQCKASTNLQNAFSLLYPPDYLTGAMCAWDKEGMPGPNSTIKTFATVQDVEDANYEIIHCGACGDCSNWNDIQLQYTSSKYLAGIATVCTKKSLFHKINIDDDNDVVVQCNHDQIGFTMPCSKAWKYDELNTKGLAIFTFMQAQLSNAFADMEVTFRDITMATIDESLSGPIFVPWVGATRRRMNIISDIRRPNYQQCIIVTQNWTEIFRDPFYPPLGGTYTIQPANGPKETVKILGQDSGFSMAQLLDNETNASLLEYDNVPK